MIKKEKALRIAVDTGGTFIDCVYLRDGEVHIVKIFDARETGRRGTFCLEANRINVKIELRHGTTVATNTLIERTGAPVAFVTTAGLKTFLVSGGRHVRISITGSRHRSSSTTYSYDTLNRLTTLAPPSAFGSGSFGFSYDALSRRTQMTRPNSITTSYTYDDLSHLTSVLHKLSGSTIDGESYTLDSDGNRTVKTDHLASVTTDYTYDYISQLTLATQGGSTTESYTYDPVGNRTASLGVSSYTTNASNEVTATSSASYTYDYNGNTTAKTIGSNTTDYSWDYENRLTSVTLPGSGGTVSFKYDPFGRRIYKSLSTGGTSVFAYDGDNLIEETNSSGTVAARYEQGLKIDEPLAMLRSSAVSYYNADGLGSITSLANGSGTLTQTYTYDSFGNITTSSGSIVNPFQYTGRELDSETGLYYYRARYYDSTTGRFVSEDPAGFNGNVMNFYSYVENNPADQKNPFGLCDKPSKPSCVWYFFKQVYNHANPLTPDVAGGAGDSAAFAYSAIQYNKLWTFISAKYSNVFRVRAIARGTEAIGRGALVGFLTTVVISEGEALYDEYKAFLAGECQ